MDPGRNDCRMKIRDCRFSIWVSNAMSMVTENAVRRPEKRSWAEPFKIKMVGPLHMTSREAREAAIASNFLSDTE